MPYYPYFLVKNEMFEVTENCIFDPRSLRLLGVCKNQINLIWAAMMQKFIKYFFFSCNSFFSSPEQRSRRAIVLPPGVGVVFGFGVSVGVHKC